MARLGVYRYGRKAGITHRIFPIPNMKSKNAVWGILVAVIALLLAACLLPPIPRFKARASRVTGVNNISSFSATGTNGLSTVTPSK